MFSGMRYTALALAVAALLFGCESKKTVTDQQQPAKAGSASPAGPRAQLTDLTTASTLAPVRAAFNAKKGEARFLTLLSPT
jgi:hypothetical protein